MPEQWGRDRQPRSGMEPGLVLELLDILDNLGIAVWLDGGWGVDALLGEQTRQHDDLDLLVGFDDVSHLEKALGTAGYATVHRPALQL